MPDCLHPLPPRAGADILGRRKRTKGQQPCVREGLFSGCGWISREIRQRQLRGNVVDGMLRQGNKVDAVGAADEVDVMDVMGEMDETHETYGMHGMYGIHVMDETGENGEMDVTFEIHGMRETHPDDTTAHENETRIRKKNEDDMIRIEYGDEMVRHERPKLKLYYL